MRTSSRASRDAVFLTNWLNEQMRDDQRSSDRHVRAIAAMHPASALALLSRHLLTDGSTLPELPEC